MKKFVPVVQKAMAKMASASASHSAGHFCPFVVYQPKMPVAVKKLRKF